MTDSVTWGLFIKIYQIAQQLLRVQANWHCRKFYWWKVDGKIRSHHKSDERANVLRVLRSGAVWSSTALFMVALGFVAVPAVNGESERERETIKPDVLVWSKLYCWLCRGATLDDVHSIISMPRCYKRDKWIVQNRPVRDPIYSPRICGY